MKSEVNLLDALPRTARDYDQRAREKTEEDRRIAKKFGFEFFDGPRCQGYGGYRYDGRWRKIAGRMRDYYGLSEEASILDVGCAKGFFLHDFKELMPECRVAGIDISEYAISNAMPSVKAHLVVGSADQLPFKEKSFDLVISINTIHNLPVKRCSEALQELQRVSKGKSYVTVDAWRTELERENLHKWVLTAETFMPVEDWQRLFDEIGYTGDYGWFIAD